MRYLFRAQFSADSRAQIRDWLAARRRESMPRPATYAELPLLNAQQVVAVWRQSITQAHEWESQTIPVEVPGKGLYLVEATHGELRAYTLLLVTDLAVVTKSAPGQILAYVVNRQSGAPVEHSAVLVWSNRKERSEERRVGKECRL